MGREDGRAGVQEYDRQRPRAAQLFLNEQTDAAESLVWVFVGQDRLRDPPAWR